MMFVLLFTVWVVGGGRIDVPKCSVKYSLQATAHNSQLTAAAFHHSP
jgi:hypothetical protein